MLHGVALVGEIVRLVSHPDRHLVFAAEKVRDDSSESAPDVTESVNFGEFRVATLESLVRMKLTAFRDTARMHLRDMIDVESVDGTWPARFPPALAARLQEMLENPESREDQVIRNVKN